MRKNVLDEMQVQRRNKIGNQSFFLLFYLLMTDIGLNGFGITWLKYPLNVYIIMLACMTYYLIRTIFNNAYVGPENVNKLSRRKAVLIGVIITAVISAVFFIIQQNFIEIKTVDVNENGATILFVFGIVALVIISISSIIAKRRNSNGDE